MTAKLDGTAGLLQQYDYQTPTTGFSYTFAAGVNVLVMQPAGTLATGTITMPAAPVDGMTITVESTQQITALTVQGNTGQSLVNGTQTLRPNQPYSWVYRLSNTTWYPFAGATNSQIVQETVQLTTSGTSKDFTGIPAWVKRITVMFQGVSASGTSGWLVQIGGASIETSGYVSSATFTGASSGGTSSTAGFFALPTAAGTATNIYTGMVTLALLDSATNTWLHQTIAGLTQSGTVYSIQGGGSKAITGALARVRITTVNGTDTFDAGSINILYE